MYKFRGIYFIAFFLFLFKDNIIAQNKVMSSGEIFESIQKLKVLGNVMYVAAHPDDENTLLLSWLSKEKKMKTAYFACTRGDGGQNLLGSEQAEYAGLLRTHELLEARKIDGGEQYFSRAIDFGFTKTTEEALLTWGKDKVLEDLVWRIRMFRPDIIITRFPPDERAGHGHHSASAVLAEEAFDAAADATKFPNQLKYTKTWQVKRLVWNTFNRGFTNTAPENVDYVTIPLGDYNPILGKSYTEIAAEARSMHRSQGFGSAKTRNERFDYAVHVKGLKAEKDLFDGIDMTWGRIEGGGMATTMINEIINTFDFKNPSKSVSQLISLLKIVKSLPSNNYSLQKISEIEDLILTCSGIYVETIASDFSASPKEKIKIFASSINRSTLNIQLEKYEIPRLKIDSTLNTKLSYNKLFELPVEVQIPKNTPISQPYWLIDKPEKGFYTVNNQELNGLAMAPEYFQSIFTFTIDGQKISKTIPVKYKYVEPSIGEIYKYFEIRPNVSVTLEQKVLAFGDNNPKKLFVIAQSGQKDIKAKIGLQVPGGWQVSPKFQEVNFTKKREEKRLEFTLTPSSQASEVTITGFAIESNDTLNRGINSIKYSHIPELNTFPLSSAKAIRIDLKKKGNTIGYIAGTGDEVPNALRQIGYEVLEINESNISKDLKKYDAIVVGVRAFNTEVWLSNSTNTLFEYVKNGGNLVVQYQTQAFYGTLKTNDLGPYPFSIGRNRVTDENSEVKFINPNAKILNQPNKITNNDFKGWIQERGLFFPDKWSDKYQTLFLMNDANEKQLESSTLYAQYGKGNYIYTSLALFRELPAGVSGAYRLMANFISMGK